MQRTRRADSSVRARRFASRSASHSRTGNLYDSSPAWNYATTGTRDEKLEKFADPEVRENIRAEIDEAIKKLGQTQSLGGPIEELLIQDVAHKPELEQYVGLTVGDVANARRRARR